MFSGGYWNEQMRSGRLLLDWLTRLDMSLIPGGIGSVAQDVDARAAKKIWA